jgi:hypothetical protein
MVSQGKNTPVTVKLDFQRLAVKSGILAKGPYLSNSQLAGEREVGVCLRTPYGNMPQAVELVVKTEFQSTIKNRWPTNSALVIHRSIRGYNKGADGHIFYDVPD